MNWNRGLILALSLLLAACTSDPRYTRDLRASSGGKKPSGRVSAAPKQPAGEFRVNQVLKGSASWYGPKFHGRPTASGEIFDMDDMTAAHKTLPLGTWVQVTNTANGRKVEVKVNDRGPFAGNRILDLSREAARRLDFIQAGVTDVEIRILTLPVNK